MQLTIQLVTLTEPIDLFVNNLLDQLLKLKRHDFIAKEQASFLAQTKRNVKDGEVVVQGDFSENNSFIVQDAVQGFHWNNAQATIHPFKGIHSLNSNHMTHDAVTVHCFVKKLLGFLCGILNVKKVYYFTDGAASQYKNRKIFVNLAFHGKDFTINAEWHFFCYCSRQRSKRWNWGKY